VQPVGGLVLDDNDSIFAYQDIAGLGYHLDGRTQLFADYRYFATADSSLSTRTNVSVDGDYADHTFLFGLRFSFAEPKQVSKATTKAEPREAGYNCGASAGRTVACGTESSTCSVTARGSSHLPRFLRLGQS
jgi:hypothetical protein